MENHYQRHPLVSDDRISGMGNVNGRIQRKLPLEDDDHDIDQEVVNGNKEKDLTWSGRSMVPSITVLFHIRPGAGQ